MEITILIYGIYLAISIIYACIILVQSHIEMAQVLHICKIEAMSHFGAYRFDAYYSETFDFETPHFEIGFCDRLVYKRKGKVFQMKKNFIAPSIVRHNIKQKMAKLSLNQKELAVRLGINQANVSKFLNGEDKHINSGTLYKYAIALECIVDELTFDKTALKQSLYSQDINSLSDKEFLIWFVEAQMQKIHTPITAWNRFNTILQKI